MCGRYTLKTPLAELARQFSISPGSEPDPGLFRRYNVAPTQDVVALRHDAEEESPQLAVLKWGLIPSWADDMKIGNRLINARLETVCEKPSFRDAVKHRRCLILADGFYEWKTESGSKLPYYIRRRDRSPFAFAGLWERWHSPTTTIESCTILTTPANELLQPLHHRMPVMLAADQFDDWLDVRTKSLQRLQPVLGSFDADEMDAVMVRGVVNDARFDDPSCVELASDLQLAEPPAKTIKRSRADQLSLWDMNE